MIYRVTLQRSIIEEAAIEVEAETSEEAEDTARTREADGMVAWTKVNDDLEVSAEPAGPLQPFSLMPNQVIPDTQRPDLYPAGQERRK